MSKDKKNKGKQGEMIVSEMLTDLCFSTPCDYIRPSTTNTPDRGVDFILEAPKGFTMSYLRPIANGEKPSMRLLESSHKKKEIIRIDVKRTNEKISEPAAKKHIQDCAKNPGCDYHILMGGQGATPKAKERLKDHSNVLYINDAGRDRLSKHFKKLKEEELAQKKNKLLTKENNNDES